VSVELKRTQVSTHEPAYLAGYAVAVNDVATHGLDYARKRAAIIAGRAHPTHLLHDESVLDSGRGK
jgi:hypothetical protein